MKRVRPFYKKGMATVTQLKNSKSTFHSCMTLNMTENFQSKSARTLYFYINMSTA